MGDSRPPSPPCLANANRSRARRWEGHRPGSTLVRRSSLLLIPPQGKLPIQRVKGLRPRREGPLVLLLVTLVGRVAVEGLARLGRRLHLEHDLVDGGAVAAVLGVVVGTALVHLAQLHLLLLLLGGDHVLDRQAEAVEVNNSVGVEKASASSQDKGMAYGN